MRSGCKLNIRALIETQISKTIFDKEKSLKNETNTMRRRTQFEVLKGTINSEGKFVKERLAGLAFLREGKLQYKLKVFPQLGNRFYIMPDEETADRYKVLVRDEVQNRKGKPKIYWCEVGEGRVLTSLGLIELTVDLWAEPLYMSIFPREVLRKATPKPFAKLGELKLVA